MMESARRENEVHVVGLFSLRKSFCDLQDCRISILFVKQASFHNRPWDMEGLPVCPIVLEPCAGRF